MSKEVVQVDGEAVELSDTPTKSKEEMYEEIRQVFILFASSAPVQVRITLIKLMALMIELIHWQHDPSGRHPSPSEMLMMSGEGGVGLEVGNTSSRKFDA